MPKRREFRDIVHQLWRWGCAPTTADLSRALWRADAPRARRVAAVWIAVKFEEVYPPSLHEIIDKLRLSVTRTQVVEAEAAVLADLHYRLPLHTRMRAAMQAAMRERRAERTLVDQVILLILWAGVADALTTDAWATALRDVHDGRVVCPLLQSVAALRKHPFGFARRRLLPPRLTGR